MIRQPCVADPKVSVNKPASGQQSRNRSGNDGHSDQPTAPRTDCSQVPLHLRRLCPDAQDQPVVFALGAPVPVWRSTRLGRLIGTSSLSWRVKVPARRRVLVQRQERDQLLIEQRRAQHHIGRLRQSKKLLGVLVAMVSALGRVSAARKVVT